MNYLSHESSEKSFPLVSIIIPLFNSEQYIKETICSLKQNTYPNIEIVVVDDHSTDHSIEVLNSIDCEILHVFSCPSKGAQSARNYGFKKSKGEYVMFMDSDDIISPYKIERQMESLLNSTDRDVLSFTSMQPFEDTPLRDKCKRRMIDHDYENPIDMLVEMWDTGEFNVPHSYLMHRSLVEKAGLWNESLIKNQDGEFFSRVISNASFVIYIAGEIAYWRMHEGSISHSYSDDRYRSQVISYKLISEIILSHDNSERARLACAKNLGRWMVAGYPYNKKSLKEAYSLLRGWHQPLTLPFLGRKFALLRMLFGWRLAKRLLRLL